MRILVTAGYKKSKAVIALCELIKRSGHEVGGIIIVTPYNIKRLRHLLIQRGRTGLYKAFKKMFASQHNNKTDYMKEFLIQHNITDKNIIFWAKKNNVDYKVVPEINALSAINFVFQKKLDMIIYGGGGILRKDIISAVNNFVINPHCGPLPEVRGMNAIEWAFLLKLPLETTVHFIDKGIDTGDIISRTPSPFYNGINLEQLRAKAVISGILEINRLLTEYQDIENFPRQKNPGVIAGRQCYVMAPALEELVSYKLNKLSCS
tara:strand:+ start:87 stop:875 length:789 start_codon:yes stop_codon:yes gene_type:complete